MERTIASIVEEWCTSLVLPRRSRAVLERFYEQAVEAHANVNPLQPGWAKAIEALEEKSGIDKYCSDHFDFPLLPPGPVRTPMQLTAAILDVTEPIDSNHSKTLLPEDSICSTRLGYILQTEASLLFFNKPWLLAISTQLCAMKLVLSQDKPLQKLFKQADISAEQESALLLQLRRFVNESLNDVIDLDSDGCAWDDGELNGICSVMSSQLHRMLSIPAAA